MFCTHCGKELKEDWKICPFCGEKVTNSAEKEMEYRADIQQDTIDNSSEVCYQDTTHTQNEEEYDFTIGNTKITGRFILKVFAVIIIACFFCPLYMVSCSGKELFSLTGVDVTFGFQYMNEDISGNIVFIALLILPIVSLLSAFVNKNKLEESEKRTTLRDLSYVNVVCSGSVALYAWFFTVRIEDNATNTALQITSLFALKIIITLSVASILVGMYLAYLAEDRVKDEKEISEKTVKAKCVGKALLGIIVGFLILGVIEQYVLDGKDVSPEIENYTETYEKDKAHGDLDIELFI